MDKIVLVDFAGTLIKPEIIEEANEFRAHVLERSLPKKEEHAAPEALYKANREFVAKLTGIADDARIQYRENDLDRMMLTGEELQNQIATNLFQIGMFMVARKYKKSIAPDGLLDALTKIKQKGFKLAIVSGVREDIITGMFSIAGIDLFNYVYGQPPILGVSNEENSKDLQEKGDIIYAIGDKLSDLEAGKAVGAKTIFVTWGHPSGGEEDFADVTISSPDELFQYVK